MNNDFWNNKMHLISTRHPEALPVTFEDELKSNHFRVVIFGSARIKRGGQRYMQVFELAKQIGGFGMDVVTGGGPGIMEAASAGHHAGRRNADSHSIGFTVTLPFEENVNGHLDIRKHFSRFSNRLDHFMALANVVIVMPGGVGTCLEFFYTWQLTQVRHMHRIPIILMGEMWEGLVQWVTDMPLKKGYISPGDMENLYIAKSNKDALRVVLNSFDEYKNLDFEARKKYKKYIIE